MTRLKTDLAGKVRESFFALTHFRLREGDLSTIILRIASPMSGEE